MLPGHWFDRIDAIAPRVPLGYVDDAVVVPDDWERGRCTYLAFGAETYAEEVARARKAAWPLQVLGDARHLHCLIRPEETAAALSALLP